MGNIGQISLDVSHGCPLSSIGLGALLNLARLFSLWKGNLLSATGESTPASCIGPLTDASFRLRWGPITAWESFKKITGLFNLLEKGNTSTS